MDHLKSIIEKADIFGENLNLEFANKEKFDTVLRGFLSLLIYMLTIALLVNEALNYTKEVIPEQTQLQYFKNTLPRYL